MHVAMEIDGEGGAAWEGAALRPDFFHIFSFGFITEPPRLAATSQPLGAQPTHILSSPSHATTVQIKSSWGVHETLSSPAGSPVVYLPEVSPFSLSYSITQQH